MKVGILTILSSFMFKKLLSFGEGSEPLVLLLGDHVKSSRVIDSCWGLVLNIVNNLFDRASQDLSTSGLWKFGHENNSLKLSKGSNISSNFANNFFRNCSLLFIILVSLSLENNESQWAFSSNFLVITNDGTLDYFVMFVDNLFESTCRDSMASGVDDIVGSCHDMDISIRVDNACVSGCVVAWGLGKILVDEGLVVTPQGQHEGWRKRELDHNFT
jgi:hypothetical protein